MRKKSQLRNKNQESFKIIHQGKEKVANQNSFGNIPEKVLSKK